jgi:hypothetical protein
MAESFEMVSRQRDRLRADVALLHRLLDQFVNHPPVNLSGDWWLLCDEARKALKVTQP